MLVLKYNEINIQNDIIFNKSQQMLTAQCNDLMFIKTQNDIIFNTFQQIATDTIRNKVLHDAKNGYKTVILTLLSYSRSLYNEFKYSKSLISSIKNNIEKVNIILHASSDQLRLINQNDFNYILIDNYKKSYQDYYDFLYTFLPSIIIGQDWNFAKHINSISPFIFINTHPYQNYLWLSFQHYHLLEMLSRKFNLENIIKIKQTDIDNNIIKNNLKSLIIQKRIDKISSHNSIYKKHINQFQAFQSHYSKIIIFAYSTLGYEVESGVEEIRRLFNLIPKDYLIIFTIHPAFNCKQPSELEGLLGYKTNKDFDFNLHAEIKGLKPDFKPLESLKKEFPNFITEFDLELKKIHGKPECPSLTDAIIHNADGVMCGFGSKISFIAMEANKPIFAYKYIENKPNFSFEVLGLETKDIANFDFDKKDFIDKYNKILHFILTRMMQLPNLGIDKNPQKFYDFIEYETKIRGEGYCEVDFEFYQKEWQTIEEVYNAFKNNV